MLSINESLRQIQYYTSEIAVKLILLAYIKYTSKETESNDSRTRDLPEYKTKNYYTNIV